MCRTCVGAFLCVLLFAGAEAATGDWDRSYGTDGLLPLHVPGVRFSFAVWKPQADGKIVTAARALTATGQDTDGYVITRLNADGTPDTSFEGDGVVRVLGGTGPVDIATLSDGRVLVAMHAGGGSGRVTLLRLNPDGSPDTTFGPVGRMTFVNPTALLFYPFRLVMAPDGAAIVLGGQLQAPGPSVVVTKVTAAGVLDAGFGTNGRVHITVVSSALEAHGIAVQADGSIALGGVLYLPDAVVPFVGRLTNNGQPDTSFGANGIAELPVLEGRGDVEHLVATNDGKIVAAGVRTDDWGNEAHFVARLNADGTLDQSFGSGGRIVVPAAIVTSLSADPDGKVVVGGIVEEFRTNLALLARYNSDGSPDVTFGLRGRSLTDFSSGLTRISLAPEQVVRDADGGYRALVTRVDVATGSYSSLVRFAAGGTSAGVIGFHGNTESSPEMLTVSERNGTYTLTAYRTGGTGGAVSVQYRLVAGTATAGQDFVAGSGTLAFNEGEVTKNFSFQTFDDIVPEPAESFYVELFEPTGGAGLSRSRLNVGFMADNDVGSRIALLHTTVHAMESAGSVRLVVQRTGDVSTVLTVNYATRSGGATAGADFTASSGSLTWAANEGGVRTFDVPLLDDTTIESAEQFTATLSSSDPVAVIDSSTGTATVWIYDNDDASLPPLLGFATSRVAVVEGAGSVAVEVHRFGDSSQALSATWGTSSGLPATATAGQDYSTATGSLSWAAGDTAPKTFTVPILDDAASEFPESFLLSLSVAYPGNVFTSEPAQVTIADNDPPASTPTVSVGPDASVAENAGTASVNITMAGTLGAGIVTVNYEVVAETAGTADFTLAAAGSLSWQPGDAASKSLSIPIVADTLDEIDESFSIHITSLSGGARFGAGTRSRITIVDDDATPPGQPAPVPPGVRLESPNMTVNDNDQSVTLRLLRTGDTGVGLNVHYVMTGGTAGSPDDFIARSGVLTWSAGSDYPYEIPIYLNGDAQAEPEETFTVRFYANLPGLGIQPPVTATVTILDDDQPSAPAQVDFVSATQSVNENATTVTLQVGRTGNTAIASSVDYATVVGSATSADFVTATGTLTWQANDTSLKLITLTLTPDANDEPDETFTVTLSNGSAGTQIGSASATVTIVDDDSAPSAPGPGGGSNGGGGQESLITLLLWAALVRARRPRPLVTVLK